jgi:AbrB family looped-hinge helix DNA binding protein
MLVTIDKRGSISLPASIRKDLGIKSGTHLELSVEAGGTIALYPVEIYRKIRLNNSGTLKSKEAREAEPAELPDWLAEDISNAKIDSK